KGLFTRCVQPGFTMPQDGPRPAIFRSLPRAKLDRRRKDAVQKPVNRYSWWSREQRPFTLAELVVDGAVHVLGLIVAIAAGSILLAFAILETAPEAAPA